MEKYESKCALHDTLWVFLGVDTDVRTQKCDLQHFFKHKKGTAHISGLSFPSLLTHPYNDL